MEIQFAPLQGYTDAAYRRAHCSIYGGIACYHSAFIRIEKGDLRTRDIRDIIPGNNSGLKLIPQIIVKDIAEFDFLCDKIQSIGYSDIDINLGCPFPLQTRKGRGAGLLPHPDKTAAILDAATSRQDISFSVKMRLGLNNPTEWHALIDSINNTPLRQVTIHPRIGTQQYKGEIDWQEFENFYHSITHPIVYNGDITSIDKISTVANKYPRLKGVMIGRGLLSRPSLAQEYIFQKELSDNERISMLMALHDCLFEHYASTLQGDTQLLMKMKSFWEYPAETISHKISKAINKSTTIAKYRTAVAMI